MQIDERPHAAHDPSSPQPRFSVRILTVDLSLLVEDGYTRNFIAEPKHNISEFQFEKSLRRLHAFIGKRPVPVQVIHRKLCHG